MDISSIVVIEKLAQIEKLSIIRRMSTQTETGLERAIRLAGGITKLARDLDLSGHQVVYQWGRTRVPAEYCPRIEELFGVRCEDLRPDINWSVLRRRARRREAA
jgi:DNA-binding transcriptional regulator YdaS (Cro superfamily)